MRLRFGMDLVFIIKSLVGLVLLLGVLIALLLYRPSKKKKEQQKLKQAGKKDSDYTFAELFAVVKDKNSSTEKLQWALNTIEKYHGNIKPKNGARVSDEFYKYSELIIRLCRHPNTTKSLIIGFDKEMRKRNPKYSKELDDSLTRGLNSRGA